MNEWRQHLGGPCPVAPETMVEAKRRDGVIITGQAQQRDWGRDPSLEGRLEIVAYRLADCAGQGNETSRRMGEPVAPVPAQPVGRTFGCSVTASDEPAITLAAEAAAVRAFFCPPEGATARSGRGLLTIWQPDRRGVL